MTDHTTRDHIHTTTAMDSQLICDTDTPVQSCDYHARIVPHARYHTTTRTTRTTNATHPAVMVDA